MSDTEIVIHLLRRIERRLRATRLQEELPRGLSVILVVLIVLKIWDQTITYMTAMGAALFVGYVVWCLRKKEGFYRAAASIDRKAALNDQMTTALWFIDHQLASEWVESQIHRAARRAAKIDVVRAYPSNISRSFYVAAGLVVVFAALNFAPRGTELPHPPQSVTTASEQAFPPRALNIGTINTGL